MNFDLRIYKWFFIFVFFVAIFFEVGAGLIRFYLSLYGFDLLAYSPKLGMILVIALIVFALGIPQTRLFLLTIFICFILISYALIINDFKAVFFSIYVLILPLIFLVLSIELLKFSKEFQIQSLYIFGFFCFFSIFGILIDFYYFLPWEGYSAVIAGYDVVGSKLWTTNGIERLAGFSRSSTHVAAVIALSSVFVIIFLKKRSYSILVYLISAVAIYYTTNKTMLLAYLLILPLFFYNFRLYFASTYTVLPIILGIVFPIIGIFVLSQNPVAIHTDNVLYSFYDRLFFTWPAVFSYFSDTSELYLYIPFLTGLGIGSVVSASGFFVDGTLRVHDNSWLYLYFSLGLFGLLFLAYVAYLSIGLLRSKSKYKSAIGIAFNLILWLSITTDAIANLLVIIIIVLVILFREQKSAASG